MQKNAFIAAIPTSNILYKKAILHQKPHAASLKTKPGNILFTLKKTLSKNRNRGREERLQLLQSKFQLQRSSFFFF